MVRLLYRRPATEADHSKAERDKQQENDHQRADGTDGFDIAFVPHVPDQDGEYLVFLTLIKQEWRARYPDRMQHRPHPDTNHRRQHQRIEDAPLTLSAGKKRLKKPTSVIRPKGATRSAHLAAGASR